MMSFKKCFAYSIKKAFIELGFKESLEDILVNLRYNKKNVSYGYNCYKLSKFLCVSGEEGAKILGRTINMQTAESRSNCIRDTVIDIGYHNKCSHIGSSLSCVDILNALFHLKYDKQLIDKIIISKGHAVLAVYSAAHEYNLLDKQLLMTYNMPGSTLMGHVTVDDRLPFNAWSLGSLGHGLSVAVGIAYVNKYIEHNNKHIACLCSDGELNEGSTWEAIMFAAHHHLDNLILIVDNNKWQALGRCDDINNLSRLNERFEVFNWRCLIRYGHNSGNLIEELKEYIDLPYNMKGKPFCIVADTIKGYGIPEIQNTLECHYKSITEEQYNNYVNNRTKT